MFKKILIANRGEIAVRIIRACREMSIGSVAVFSAADRTSQHVLQADEAYPIGASPSTESYLRIDKLMDVARHSGADALHPGYGFLAENPALPRACRAAGICFIGPSAEAMELLGSKTAARQTARRVGAPVIPGSEGSLATEAEAARLAADWGYPVLLKAVAGGGGKGMRIIRTAEQWPGAWRDARAEAQNAFGDPSLYLERYLERPRHVEIQILGDEHGNLIHLGERECSLQRRHQKLVEESPSPLMNPALREEMGGAAVEIARAAGYTNAGTLEFLVVPSTRRGRDWDFYFLEVNTRLQVEHPVTEIVTGLDLVKEQFRIAAGEKLAYRQGDIEWRGAAIECRLYAEDPSNNFFPCPGRITRLERPAGPGVRVDGSVYEGWNVPVEYDALLAKLICWGRDRREAIARLGRALDEYVVGGIETNLSFFRRLVGREEFLRGELDTELVDRLLAQWAESAPAPELADVTAIAAALAESATAAANGSRLVERASRWKQAARADSLNSGRRPPS